MLYSLGSSISKSLPAIIPKKTSSLVPATHTRAFSATPKRKAEEELTKTPRIEKFLSYSNLKKLGIREELLPPKRPQQPFFLFKDEWVKAGKASGLSFAETPKALGEAWNNLSEPEKQVYRERWAKEFAEHYEKYQKWAKNIDPEVMTLIKQCHKEKTPVAPGLGRPGNSFIMFKNDYIKAYMEEHGHMLNDKERNMFKEVTSDAAKAWRELPEAEKEVYKRRYQKEREKYFTK